MGLTVRNTMKRLHEEMAEELRTLGETVRRRRIAANISQTKLAILCGISNKQMWNVEHGKNWPSLPVYLLMCRSLGVKGLLP